MSNYFLHSPTRFTVPNPLDTEAPLVNTINYRKATDSIRVKSRPDPFSILLMIFPFLMFQTNRKRNWVAFAFIPNYEHHLDKKPPGFLDQSECPCWVASFCISFLKCFRGQAWEKKVQYFPWLALNIKYHGI